MVKSPFTKAFWLAKAGLLLRISTWVWAAVIFTGAWLALDPIFGFFEQRYIEISLSQSSADRPEIPVFLLRNAGLFPIDNVAFACELDQPYRYVSSDFATLGTVLPTVYYDPAALPPGGSRSYPCDPKQLTIGMETAGSVRVHVGVNYNLTL